MSQRHAAQADKLQPNPEEHLFLRMHRARSVILTDHE